jgi:hypothetical protein
MRRRRMALLLMATGTGALSLLAEWEVGAAHTCFRFESPTVTIESDEDAPCHAEPGPPGHECDGTTFGDITWLTCTDV